MADESSPSPAAHNKRRCRLDGRFLVVTGKLRSYRIPLGSSNVMMTPNDQYLCVVQDRANSGARVRLTFEGDNLLALILSKAFRLANDDKITNRAITRSRPGDSRSRISP